MENGKVEPTLSSLEKIAELFDENEPIDVNSYDKSIVERLRLLDN